MKARDFTDTTVAAIIGASVCFFVVRGIYETIEPKASRETNVADRIQAAFPETNSFAMVDTNVFPTLTFSSDDSATGIYKTSSNVVTFAHSGRNVITLGKGYEQTEDPNEVTITFHGKDGSVWVPTWTKQ